MPPFGPARPDSGPGAGLMSTFALGQMQVRRSGYGAMQLTDPFAFGSRRTGHRPSACSGPEDRLFDDVPRGLEVQRRSFQLRKSLVLHEPAQPRRPARRWVRTSSG